MRLIKDGHNANFDSHAPPKQHAPEQQPTETTDGNQHHPPQPATSPGPMSGDQLKTKKDEFMTTALRAARLTPLPPNTAPPPEETKEDDRYEHDDHFYTPRRPDNASSAFVRSIVLNDLRYLWEILAKMFNEYEQILNTAADEKDKYDGRRANDEDENENYQRGKANRESNDPTEDRNTRHDKRQTEKETRRTEGTQPKTPKAAPMNDYRTAAFGERRFGGAEAIDAAASTSLETAHKDKTDGLRHDDDTITILEALARQNEPYAAKQLEILRQPGPATNADRPTPQPRHPPAQYSNPTAEAELHAEQQEATQRADHGATFARETHYFWSLREAKNLQAAWQSHNITGDDWCPDALGMTYQPPRDDHEQMDDALQVTDAGNAEQTTEKRAQNAEINDAPDETTQTNPAATDAENSQHDPAADADDEQEETSTQRPESKETTKTRKNKRGTNKRGASTGLNPRQRIGKTRKRTDPHPTDPNDAREYKRPKTPDAGQIARPPAPPQHQATSHQTHDAPTDTQPSPRPPKRATDRQMMSPSQRPRSTETNRQTNNRDETGAAAETNANQQTRSQPIAPQAQRPPASQ